MHEEGQSVARNIHTVLYSHASTSIDDKYEVVFPAGPRQQLLGPVPIHLDLLLCHSCFRVIEGSDELGLDSVQRFTVFAIGLGLCPAQLRLQHVCRLVVDFYNLAWLVDFDCHICHLRVLLNFRGLWDA